MVVCRYLQSAPTVAMKCLVIYSYSRHPSPPEDKQHLTDITQVLQLYIKSALKGTRFPQVSQEKLVRKRKYHSKVHPVSPLKIPAYRIAMSYRHELRADALGEGLLSQPAHLPVLQCV